jgi:hypothetical protein
MQFRVPQNITMEDRIAGPFTAIQFAILVIGGLLSFLVFTSVSIPAPLNQAAGGFMGLLTLVMSVGKFNDQPMYRFFRFIIAFVLKPKVRVWHKAGSEPILVRPSHHKNDGQSQRQSKRLTKSDIAGLAAVVDSRGQYGVVPSQSHQEKK